MAKTMTEIPEGRRPIVRGELLFRGQKHAHGEGGRRKTHLWMAQTGRWGTVVACSVCGRIRQGETMPAGSEPLLP